MMPVSANAKTLRQELEHRPIVVGTLAEAVEVALSSRPDFQAQKKREERVKLQSSAAKWERLPSLHGFADYGSLGTSINNSLPTRSIGISVTVPVFDGGRLDARRAEVLSLFDQERIKSEDLREQIQLEVRVSPDSVRRPRHR
jgi:outer membrane protein TolC